MLKKLTLALSLAGISILPVLAQEPQLVPTNPLVTFDLLKTPLADVMAEIGKQSGIAIRYQDVPRETLARSVSVSMRRSRVEDALQLILKSSNLSFKVVDATTILVTSLPTPQ